MTSKQKVTVLIPTFNRQPMLERALLSIQNQTWKDFAVIVLDNGSTPPAILPKEYSKDPRFHLKRIEKNSQRHWFLTDEIQCIKSKYLAFLFDDDVWEPEKLAKQIAILEEKNNIVACFTHATIINDQGETYLSPPAPYPMIFQQPNRSQAEFIRYFFRYGNFLCQPSSLIRSKALQSIISPPRPYTQLHDFMVWVKLLAFGNFHIIPEPLTRYRVSETGANESHMTPATRHRLNYEFSRILHLFLQLPPHILKESFIETPAGDIDLENAIFRTAIATGSQSHIRFAIEYSEDLFKKYSNKNDRDIANYWLEEYAKISCGSYQGDLSSFGEYRYNPTLEIFTKKKTDIKAQSAENFQQQLRETIAAFHNNDLNTATHGLSALVAALPKNPLPFAYLSFISATQGLFQEAEEFINKALAITPERVDLLAALGESFLKKGHTEEAARYLQLAIEKQPDLFAAYPALARCLCLMGQGENAVLLLKVVAAIPSEAQANIQTTLLEILAQQGDIAVFAETCLRYSRGLADDLLAARTFARFEPSGELLVGALSAAQARLAELPLTESAPSATSTNAPLRIAFMVSDFAHEQRHGRLFTLLRHLSPEHFITALLINTPCATLDDYAQSCFLITDYNLDIHADDDATALDKITALAPDVLIDLDSYGPADRLTVFAQARVPFKLTWGEAPMPPLIPNCQPLVGEFIADDAMLPGITLPGLGECLTLPELPIAPSEAFAPGGTRFGCLTPAIRIGPESWQLFAEILLACPQSTLTLNLKDLGDSARTSITHRFTAAGVDAARLCFVEAHTVEELCRRWTSLDLGLAPPVDSGDLALPACLWMGRPFVAMAASLPWSHRPAALLECAGAAAWIADTPERYLELAAQRPPAPDNALREHLRTFTDPAAFVQGFAASITAMVRNGATSQLSA